MSLIYIIYIKRFSILPIPVNKDGIDLLPLERRQQILDLIKKRKSITVAHLSKTFYVSEATIRRDLNKLEKENLIKRSYGGAVLVDGLNAEIPLSVRVSEQKSAKDIIGKLASQLVKDGDIIIVDSSSTTLKMIPYLASKQAKHHCNNKWCKSRNRTGGNTPY